VSLAVVLLVVVVISIIGVSGWRPERVSRFSKGRHQKM